MPQYDVTVRVLADSPEAAASVLLPNGDTRTMILQGVAECDEETRQAEA